KNIPSTHSTHHEKSVDKMHDQFHKVKKIEDISQIDPAGATRTAHSVMALRSKGYGKVAYLVPNPFEEGYGESPEEGDPA
ncbi:single-stranded-DNA-specific exonuclease RecJ, partial [Klebsiella pneumoniae]|nr:single-stranded-DNA-specific exonuclease RecJ [Klebsiella pneumoniae]